MIDWTMKYLTLKYIFYVMILSLLITSCDAPDPVAPEATFQESTKSLEPTKSIDIPTENPENAVDSDEISYAIYTDSKSKTS